MLFVYHKRMLMTFFFFSNVHRCVHVNRCHHRTFYKHVVAKFIRSMLHCVTCSDLIGLLKSCSVFWAFKTMTGFLNLLKVSKLLKSLYKSQAGEDAYVHLHPVSLPKSPYLQHLVLLCITFSAYHFHVCVYIFPST